MGQEERILVIIPAYNEEGSVNEVIQEVRGFLAQADILVVNDGSSDQTSDRAKECQARVLDLPFNLGIGGAMQAGYQYAFERGYDVAIQVDGDGQHDPKEIPKLLNVLRDTQVDLVIGSRFRGTSGYKASPMRRLGISILSVVISMIIRQRIADPTSGFRVTNQRAIRLFAASYPQDYPEPEVLVLMSRCGMTMKEVPVDGNQRRAGESSITKTQSIYYMIKVLLAIFVDCFKERPLLI
jgi:hypothetical protein